MTVHPGYERCKKSVAERRAEPLDIDEIGNSRLCGGDPAVDIRLDGICNDRVGLFRADDPAVFPEKGIILCRVCPSAVNLCLYQPAAYPGQLFFASDKRGGDDNLAARKKLGNKLPAELPEHI